MAAELANGERFISALFNLSNAIKSEGEHCCRICGDLSEKELFIIAYIGENGSVNMSAIADYLQAPLSTLTSIVDRLVSNKFLLRHNSNDDRRVVKVVLDRKGKASYKEFKIRKEIIAEKALGHLTVAEQESLITYLDKLAISIQP
jgi:DNA-binding MarR family transcriptional regulator